MSVNDLVVQGAKPLFFLDYISINKIDLKKMKSLIKGIIKGCNISQCSLVGVKLLRCQIPMKKVSLIWLVLQLVSLMEKNTYQKKGEKNDLILAVPSSGLHSNGFSLVRYLVKQKKIDIKKIIS